MNQAVTLLSRALDILQPPYRFGDENQIWAISILRDLAELREIVKALPGKSVPCETCRGGGDIKCSDCGHRSVCSQCGGNGRIVIMFHECEWIDAEHLRKHLAAMRAELAEVRGGAAA